MLRVRFSGITGNTDTLQILVPNVEGVYQLAELVGGEAPQDFLQKSKNLSDVADPAAAFDAIKQASTPSKAGAVSLATQAEVDTGTDATKAVTPETFANAAKWATAGGKLRFLTVVNATARLALTASQVNVGDLVEQADTRAVYQTLDTALLNQETGYVLVGIRGAAVASGLMNGLLAYWKLDEETGARVDATGNGYNLTDNNGVGFAPGVIGNAASFNGSNFLSNGDITQLVQGIGELTVCAWAFLNTIPSSYVGLVACQNFNNGNFVLFAYPLQDGDGQVIVDGDGNPTGAEATFGSDASGGRVYTEGGVQIPVGAWVHVVGRMSVSAGAVDLFVNGVKMSSVASNGVTSSDAYTLTIGSISGGSEAWLDGKMDEVGVWNRALSDAEITALYNSGAGKTYPLTN